MDGLLALADRGRGRHLCAVRPAQEGRADPQCAAAGRHRLHPTEQVGHRRSTATGPSATPGRDSCARCRGSSSRRCAPNWRERRCAPSPQTRDMNPIYTGKDVSYIDTKQANRAAENAVLDAERFAVFAALLTGAEYPQAALAKAWVQLAYGAHHDAITGSESDQVYLDLLTGWRDAWELGRAARDNSLALLSSAVDVGGHGRGVESADAPAHRHRHRPARLADRGGGASARPRRRRAARTRRARRPVGQLAGARRAVAGLAGLSAGRPRRRTDRLGTGGRVTRSPTSTTGWRSTRRAAGRCPR